VSSNFLPFHSAHFLNCFRKKTLPGLALYLRREFLQIKLSARGGERVRKQIPILREGR
jgi:hypothetical protein